MSTYVMSDIHACFSELQVMLEQINFSKVDRLILAGDYIDRGEQNYEMLKWIENCPDNIILLRGNHEEEFAYCIDLLQVIFKKNNLDTHSYEDMVTAYVMMKELAAGKGKQMAAFDYYGTIGKLMIENSVCMEQLERWRERIRSMPFVFKASIAGKNCVVVHAGYIENLDGVETEDHFDSVEDFYLYARDDAYICGGIEHGIVVAGHTPTCLPDELPYNEGNVYRFYDKELDCVFYDIDCGCCQRGKIVGAKLACIRLEDERIFYVK